MLSGDIKITLMSINYVNFITTVIVRDIRVFLSQIKIATLLLVTLRQAM